MIKSGEVIFEFPGRSQPIDLDAGKAQEILLLMGVAGVDRSGRLESRIFDQGDDLIIEIAIGIGERMDRLLEQFLQIPFPRLNFVSGLPPG